MHISHDAERLMISEKGCWAEDKILIGNMEASKKKVNTVVKSHYFM